MYQDISNNYFVYWRYHGYLQVYLLGASIDAEAGVSTPFWKKKRFLCSNNLLKGGVVSGENFIFRRSHYTMLKGRRLFRAGTIPVLSQIIILGGNTHSVP